MKLPKPASALMEVFEHLVEGNSHLTVKKVFGQPAAFVNGNMCFGVFGSDVFFRLSEGDRKLAAKIPRVRPFEPMPGRPMREYLVLPPAVLADAPEARRWVKRSVKHTLGLPPKGTRVGPPGSRT